MSNINENPKSEEVNEAIAINENGEVVITDSKLADVLQELSAEELDAIAGGCGCGSGTTVNTAAHCGAAVTE